MDSAININISPIQVLLALAFQIWIVAFPIIIIIKLNRINALLQKRLSDHHEDDE